MPGAVVPGHAMLVCHRIILMLIRCLVIALIKLVTALPHYSILRAEGTNLTTVWQQNADTQES
jgi:hypothetical protein